MGRIREQHLLQNNSCWQCNCIKKIKIPLHVHRENERKTKNDWKNEMNVEKPLIWNWKGNESLSDDSSLGFLLLFLFLVFLLSFHFCVAPIASRSSSGSLFILSTLSFVTLFRFSRLRLTQYSTWMLANWGKCKECISPFKCISLQNYWLRCKEPRQLTEKDKMEYIYYIVWKKEIRLAYAMHSAQLWKNGKLRWQKRWRSM